MSEEATWAADEESIDYAHLRTPLDTAPFTFTGRALRRLAQLNRFVTATGRDRVLFGLRGCRVVDGGGAFAGEVRLAEAIPNHVTFECTLGVWKPSTDEIAVFPGSTVPNARFMPLQLHTNAQKCNLLLTGRYQYTVGIHLAGSNGEMRGVFKEADTVVVLRSKDDLCYKNTDSFDSGNVGDNIHPARQPIPGRLFSSEGCQTVPGHFSQPNQHHGQWRQFRELAGLQPDDDVIGQPRFAYILLTGREARLVSTLPEDQHDTLKRLRFGSSDIGADRSVTELQTALRAGGFLSDAPDGSMKRNTVTALIRRQKSGGSNAADGIFVG